jgi:uncharacterized protein (DUF3820 family)
VNPDELAARMAEDMAAIERMRMPFGKFGPQHFPPYGVPIFDLPVEYLAWFNQKGFPKENRVSDESGRQRPGF